MKKYVTGFLFSADASHVVLIKKINPQWQRGLFNGIGGKVEENESSIVAMVREFKEETGVLTQASNWTHYANVFRPNNYDVDMYFAFSDVAYSAQTIEQETVHILPVDKLGPNLIPNLHWLIPLALDKQADFSLPVSIREVAEQRISA